MILHNCTSMSATLVIDTSVIVAVLLQEPTRPALLDATRGTELVSAPSLPWEVGNALFALCRRSRITVEMAESALRAYAAIPVRLATVDLGASVQLAAKHGIYAYDAYVVECARRYQSPLLSLDRGQIEVARREGIETWEL